jgi:membrane protein YdbS with pleckstrin-like domain
LNKFGMHASLYKLREASLRPFFFSQFEPAFQVIPTRVTLMYAVKLSPSHLELEHFGQQQIVIILCVVVIRQIFFFYFFELKNNTHTTTAAAFVAVRIIFSVSLSSLYSYCIYSYSTPTGLLHSVTTRRGTINCHVYRV